ncbi:hypothetical protein G6011_06743 [Alternaria panax]|uniref:Uncharacterized protein n=1 Tax=Alternaria panax TaxID=48097 RepID=A0AAD4FIA8_9PLEO|nr:hypothetical protein G6011_06743 [Alternaria panax]
MENDKSASTSSEKISMFEYYEVQHVPGLYVAMDQENDRGQISVVREDMSDDEPNFVSASYPTRRSTDEYTHNSLKSFKEARKLSRYMKSLALAETTEEELRNPIPRIKLALPTGDVGIAEEEDGSTKVSAKPPAAVVMGAAYEELGVEDVKNTPINTFNAAAGGLDDSPVLHAQEHGSSYATMKLDAEHRELRLNRSKQEQIP